MRFSTSSVLALAAASAGTVSARVLGQRSCHLVPATDFSFAVSKDPSTGLETTDTLTYHLGAGAGQPGARSPCSLVALFAEGFPVSQSGETLIDVRALSGTNAPAGSLVGSFRIDSNGGAAQTTVINSFVCQPDMSFSVEISSDERPGQVSFTADNTSGVFMQVGQC